MRTILVILILFFSYFYTVFSFEAEISIDKNELQMDESFKLILNIKKAENLENIKILNFDLEKNFDIIWESQSIKTFSNLVSLSSWKVEEQNETSINYNFILSPKNFWEFQIWPIILDDWEKKVETNSLSVKILANQKNDFNQDEKIQKNDEKIEKKIDFKYFYIFIIIFLIWIFIIKLLIIKSRKSKIKEEKIFENQEKKIEEKIDLDEKINKISLLEKEEFIFEIEKILQKNNLFFDDLSNENLQKIKKILDKMKYSNLEVDKNEVFENLKKILEK